MASEGGAAANLGTDDWPEASDALDVDSTGEVWLLGGQSSEADGLLPVRGQTPQGDLPTTYASEVTSSALNPAGIQTQAAESRTPLQPPLASSN